MASSGPSRVRPNAQSSHMLTLRVMRLYQPQLQTSLGSTLQAFSDSPVSTLGSMSLSDVALRGSFGKIWAGQTFHAYVACLNHTKLPASHVELHTTMIDSGGQGRTHAVYDSREASSAALPAPRSFPQLAAGAHGDSVIKVPMPAAGLHTLQVNIKYIDFHGSPREIKRYFKFEVHNPFAATLSTVPAQSHLNPLSTGTVVNAVLRNVTEDAVCLGAAEFACREHCSATLLQRTLPGGHDGAGAQPKLPQWLQQCESGAEDDDTEADLPAWHPARAAATEPLLLPGQEVEYSFLVVREVVAPADADAAAPVDGEGLGSAPVSGPAVPPGYDCSAHKVVQHSDAALGRMQLGWTTHMGEQGQWRSASVASSASCPQICHIAAPRSLQGAPLQPCTLPVTLTHLPAPSESGAAAQTAGYVVRLRCKDTRSCAVVGDETLSTGSMQPCQVASVAFQLLPLQPGAYRSEIIVSPQVAELDATGPHELDHPISEGKPIAWNTVDFVVQ